MFRHEGPARSDRLNRIVACYLALIGGYVNSAGFVLIGSFTSHVTGNVGRFAGDLESRKFGAAAAALTMIFAFFAGSFLASMALESNFFGRTANAYGAALFAEALFLFLFTLAFNATMAAHPRLKDMEASMLCVAMGMQNSLVTRLSGAVVRTTHLTGVVTDIGIEAARWFRWWRGRLSEGLRVKLSFGRNPPERPLPQKSALLGTIAGAFTVGAVLGAAAVVAMPHGAMLVPSVAITSASVYAIAMGRRSGNDINPHSGARP